MIQQTEPTTNSRRLQVDETDKVSSTICFQIEAGCEIEWTQIVSVSALLGLSHCINRE
jgi:hypothetical protein